jgi:hypothetical protein
MHRSVKKSAALVAATLLAVVLGWFAYGYLYDLRLEHKFDQVSKGMSEQEVQAAMGKPNKIDKCGELGGYPSGCSKEYLYDPRLPVIENWAVFFNAEGLTLDKYDYISP